MERIYGYDMTTTSGGNISIRDEDGSLWMTPARVDKGRLERRDIVRILPEGTVEGIHPPSSEHPFHRKIYAARPELGAVLHAHPGALVSFSICGQVPDTKVFPEAWTVCGEVAFAPYALPGSERLGDLIAAQFASEKKPTCVILENHGVVVAGANLDEAFARIETLEVVAQMILNASRLGSVKTLSSEQLAMPQQRRPPAKGAAVRESSREMEARQEICDFVHRAYEHRLMTATWGTFSVRLDEDIFVISPHGTDRQSLTPADLVVIRNGACAADQRPSHAWEAHRAVYRRHPQISSIVNALPSNAGAFGIVDALLDTRTIPESYLFLKDVGVVPFERQFGDGSGIASAISVEKPVALLEFNGAMVAGRSVLDAFDRLEVLEATASAIIRSRALGPIRPMAESVIKELLAAFPGV